MGHGTFHKLYRNSYTSVFCRSRWAKIVPSCPWKLTPSSKSFYPSDFATPVLWQRGALNDTEGRHTASNETRTYVQFRLYMYYAPFSQSCTMPKLYFLSWISGCGTNFKMLCLLPLLAEWLLSQLKIKLLLTNKNCSFEISQVKAFMNFATIQSLSSAKIAPQ